MTICTTADDVLDLVKGTSIPDTETAELVARIQEYSDDALTVILVRADGFDACFLIIIKLIVLSSFGTLVETGHEE